MIRRECYYVVAMALVAAHSCVSAAGTEGAEAAGEGAEGEAPSRTWEGGEEEEPGEEVPGEELSSSPDILRLIEML